MAYGYGDSYFTGNRSKNIQCERCGSMCYGMQAYRDHSCVGGKSHFQQGSEMGNVAICNKCGNPAMTDVMGQVVFKYNPHYQSLDALLCKTHTAELYAWFQNSPVAQANEGAFDPDTWKEEQKAIQAASKDKVKANEAYGEMA